MNKAAVMLLGLSIALPGTPVSAQRPSAKDPAPSATHERNRNGEGEPAKGEGKQRKGGRHAEHEVLRGPASGLAVRGDLHSFADYDLNGDGKLTESEFNRARSTNSQTEGQPDGPLRTYPDAPTFADMDASRDGTVTGEEFAAYQHPRRKGVRPTR